MKKYFPLIVIIIFGVVLRFFHNLDISLWHDEAFSAMMIKYSWGEMFYRLGMDVHPPAYYVALKLWDYVFGNSLLALRGFSLLFAAGSIWAAWAFVKTAFKDNRAALWAAIFVAINPFQLHYANEARMYTFGTFFALLAGYFLVKALNNQKELFEAKAKNMPNTPETKSLRSGMLCGYVGFIISTAIIINTHYYLFFTAAALMLYGILYLFFHHPKSWKKYLPLLLSFIVIVLSFLPWLKSFLFQYNQVQEGYWIPKMGAWSIPATFWDMLLGFSRDVTKESTQVWLALVTLFSAFVFFRFIKKSDAFHKWLVFLAVIAPFAGALLFALLAKLKGSDSSVYLDRYFLYAGAYYCVALAVWMKNLKFKWVSAGLFIAIIGLNLVAFVHYWKSLDVESKPGMAAAAKFLGTNAVAGDKVYVASSFIYFNYKYYNTFYYPTEQKPLLYTGGRNDVSQISHVEGNSLLTNNDLLPDFSQPKTGDTVWMVYTSAFGASEPSIPLNWTKIQEKGWNDVRPYPGAWVYIRQYKVN